MRNIFILVFIFIVIIPLSGCDVSPDVESLALKFFHSELYENDKYFENTHLVIKKELLPNEKVDFNSVMPCEKIGKLKNLVTNKTFVIQNWNKEKYSNLSLNGFEDQTEGDSKVEVNVLKKVLNKDGEFVVEIQCSKKIEKEFTYVMTFLIFLDFETKEVKDWCQSPLVW